MLFDNLSAEMTDATAVSEEKTQEKQAETAAGDGSIAADTETDKNKAFITEVDLYAEVLLVCCNFLYPITCVVHKITHKIE
jgi:hypothetical protein